jgi:hypothetical protein
MTRAGDSDGGEQQNMGGGGHDVGENRSACDLFLESRSVDTHSRPLSSRSPT